MAFSTRITITHDRAKEIRSADAAVAAADLARIFSALKTSDLTSFDVYPNGSAGVKASGTLTVDAGNLQADDYVTVGLVQLTAKASPSGSAQFAVGGSAAASATNLAACINAHATVSQYVSASANGRVVTITAKASGAAGNLIGISASDASVVASAAYLAGGAGVTDVSLVSYSL